VSSFMRFETIRVSINWLTKSVLESETCLVFDNSRLEFNLLHDR